MAAILKYGVILSAVISLFSLLFMVLRTFSFGKKPLYAEPSGDIKKGIVYAFGKGMMPWEKESAQNHLLTYFSGIFYHVSIFISLIYLGFILFTIKIPVLALTFFRVFSGIGVFCGFSLLLKRWFAPAMRALSCPDDYVSNLMVNGFMILTLFHTFFPGVQLGYFMFSMTMFLYIPMGKIRHCFFFFVIRILFGIFYGRRGIYPPQKKVRFEK